MEVPIPNEIITKILSYLGKNDLLKCRLVSQSWNGLSLNTLRNPKHDHFHVLNQDNIEKFLEFSNGRSEEWLLPFYLSFELGDESENEDDEDSVSVDYEQIPNYIQQLQTIFGQNCVNSLALSHDSSSSLESVEMLISILTLIAQSLSYLNLSEFKIRYYEEEEEKMKLKKMLGKTQLNFPNLSGIKSCPPPTSLVFLDGDEEIQNEDNEILSFLIEKSKNLKELGVICPHDLWRIHKIRGLRTLVIKDVLQLDVPFTFPTLPVLNDLSFTYSKDFFNYEILNQFLSSFSTSLQRLTVTFEEIPTNQFAFPRLSHLTFLRIHVLTTRRRICVYPEDLNLSSEAFPLLHSLDISTNVHFEPTDANSSSLTDDGMTPIMLTVKNLRVTVLNSPFSSWEMDQIGEQGEDVENLSNVSANEYADQLLCLYPNLTSLTLVNESDGHDEFLNDLLTGFIQSDLASTIKKLEIQNCGKNYLGHILNGLDRDIEDVPPPPRVIIENMRLNEGFQKAIEKAFYELSGVREDDVRILYQIETRDGVENSVITCKPTIIQLQMTGLEKIHLSFSEQFNDDSGESGSGIEQELNQKDLFLMSLPKHLPLLKQINISKEMFGHDQEFCKQQIDNVQEKYPDLIINTTR